MDHGERAHALLSASGAPRWLVCTPSPRLEEEFPSQSSSFAEEGTLAHEFADIGVKLEIGMVAPKAFEKRVDELRKNALYTDEMTGEVKKYIDYVMEQYNLAKVKTPDAIIMVEERVDYSHIVEQGFGTCDNMIIADGVLEVIDLKYGKGVRVSAEDNAQLKLYGLGALRNAELMYDIKTVRLTIVQPRLDAVSSWDISADDLRKWGEEVVRPAALKAYAGEGELVAGSHCKFCKVKARCKALAQLNLEVARHEFTDPHLLDDKELIEVYKKMPLISSWIASVEEYLLAEAKNGKKWPEHKLVEGRANRVWTNAEDVKKTLLAEGYPLEKIMSVPAKPSLLGITAMEKVVGAKQFPIILGTLVTKPKGAPILVPESDKRPAFGAEKAADDFAEVDANEI